MVRNAACSPATVLDPRDVIRTASAMPMVESNCTQIFVLVMRTAVPSFNDCARLDRRPMQTGLADCIMDKLGPDRSREKARNRPLTLSTADSHIRPMVVRPADCEFPHAG